MGNDGGRRALLAVAASLVVGGAGIGALLLTRPERPKPLPPQRVGARSIVPPLLRARLGAEDMIFVLTRRPEQDATDPADRAAPRDRIDLIGLAGPGLEQRFAVHLASFGRGMRNDVALLGEQGGTLWIWLDGLTALSAETGRLLATPATLEARNPAAAGLGRALRSQVRVSDAVVFEASGVGWRIDPRDFTVVATTARTPRSMPRMVLPSRQDGPGEFRVNEARVGQSWLGLAPMDAKLALAPGRAAGTRFLAPAAQDDGAPVQLWRARLGSTLAAPPGWTAKPLDGLDPVERLLEETPVAAVTGLMQAGFLTAGTEAALVLTDPPGLLVLEGAPGEALSLLRVDAAGEVAWRSALPLARLHSVIPGAGHVVLAGWGAPPEGREAVVAVSLADGAVATGFAG